MKNYRLIVDPAQTRRACFLKATQIYQRIWRAVTYQNAAVLISEAELILGKERVFVARQRPSLRACLSAQVLFPEFIRNILASDFVLGARSTDS